MWLLRRLFGKKEVKSARYASSVSIPGITDEAIARNEKAHALETTGDIEQAIKLYERSVRESFAGSFPYTRLRIIYTKQKRFDDAIRVCKAYIDNPYLSKGSRQKGVPEFKSWILKLEAKKQ